MREYVAYIRVSTKQQEVSGLGLDAQQDQINRFVVYNKGVILQTFIDIESGGNCDRVGMNSAIKKCQDTGATLLVAKLDRLSRDVHFVSGLMKEGVSFECCDMPGADDFTKHLFASFAELERKKIQQRTREALARKKARGETLGNPKNFTNETRALGPMALREKSLKNPANMRALMVITDGKRDKLTLDEIANRLNRYGFSGPRGGKWNKTSVSRLWNKSKI